MVDKILYFAYGSNMSFDQMRERCPDSKFVCKGFLNGYEFVFDGFSNTRNGAVANVIEKEGTLVEGGLFEITESDSDKLDDFEGYPYTYKKKEFSVMDCNKKILKAIVYYRNPEPNGKPSEEYREIILKGSKDCNLSDEYVDRYLKRSNNDKQ